MKIYEYVRIDIDTGETLEEVSYEYDGPIAHCGGGGSGSTTTTTSVDKDYNARLAQIAEEQQDWAGDFKNIYQFGIDYDPNEKVTGYYDESGTFTKGAAPTAGPEEGFTAKDGTWVSKDRWLEIYRKGPNMSSEERDYFTQGQTVNIARDWDTRVNPEYKQVSGTMGEIMGYNPDEVVSQLELEQMQTQSNAELVPLQTEQAKQETMLGTERAETMRSLIPQMKEVGERYYGETLDGVDVNDRVNKAAADVGQAFSGAEQRQRVALGGMGIDPSSGRGRNEFSKTGLTYGRSLAGAKTAARTQAEAEQYERLKNAAGVTASL